ELRQGRPVLRVEFAWVEGFRQLVEEAIDVSFIGTHQRVRNHHSKLRIDRPVDEQAEAEIAEPFQALRLVQRSRRDVTLRDCRQGQTQDGEGGSTHRSEHAAIVLPRGGGWIVGYSCTAKMRLQ